MRRIVLFLAIAVVFIGAPASARAAETERFRVPPGYRVALREELGAGLVHYRLTRRSPEQVVHVAWRAPGSPSELRVVLSNEAVWGSEPRAERTSSMCVRVRCLVGVNGDFWAEVGPPHGAVVTGGALLRSPNPKHHQLTMSPDGSLVTGVLDWRGTLVLDDLRSIELDAVNRDRDAEQTVLYTPAFGPSTATNRHGVELLLTTVRPHGPLRLGQTTVVELAGFRRGGDTPIPPGGAVLSAHGRAAVALEAAWRRIGERAVGSEALLRLDTTPLAAESMGGSPILVRDGKRWFADEPRELYSMTHPRTMVGWTDGGALLLVTVDGRQAGYSRGMTMVETADLMIAMGAKEAINMDGGGSTTFVVGGDVVNRPSDRVVRRSGKKEIVRVPRSGERVLGNVERPVAIALMLIPDRLSDPPRDAAGLGRSLNIRIAQPGFRGLPRTDNGIVDTDPAPTLLIGDDREPDAGPELATVFVVIAAGAAVWRRRVRAYAR